MSADPTRTSATLLDRLRDPSNRTAWGRFAGLYGERIRAWCLCRGLQEADADEICQQLLTEIHERVQNFQYDPARGRFRDWLRTVTRNACTNYLAREPSRRFRELIEDIPARDELESEIDREVRLEVMRTALGRVQARVSERDWGIFRDLVLVRRPGTVVAQELGMKVTAVYMAKHRVLEQVKRELRHLESD